VTIRFESLVVSFDIASTTTAKKKKEEDRYHEQDATRPTSDSPQQKSPESRNMPNQVTMRFE
jgi:hypothetical protein